MGRSTNTVPPPSWIPEATLAGFFAAVTSLFAVFVPGIAVFLVPAVVALSVAGFLVRHYTRQGGREGALVFALVAVVLVTALAPTALAAEVLAGFSALAALLWASADPYRPSSLRYRTSGLVLPGLAVAVAVIVSGVLPSTQSLVGVAAGLVIGVVFWIAYVLTRPEPFRIAPSDEPEPS